MLTSSLGGTIDVDPAKIGGNIGASVLLNSPEHTGNIVDATEPDPTLHISVRDPSLADQLGSWFKVPDDSVIVTGHDFTFDTYVWNLPNGSAIIPTRDEIRGEWPWVHLHDTYYLKNVYIKLTANTRPGMIAFGYVDADTAKKVAPNQPVAPPSVTTAGAVARVATALMVVALVGAAIWFLPKGFAKGGVA